MNNDSAVVWYAPIDPAGNLGYQHKDRKGAQSEARDRIAVYGSPWRVARLEWDRADVYNIAKPDRIIRTA